MKKENDTERMIRTEENKGENSTKLLKIARKEQKDRKLYMKRYRILTDLLTIKNRIKCRREI
jgi:hypothetical protein